MIREITVDGETEEYKICNHCFRDRDDLTTLYVNPRVEESRHGRTKGYFDLEADVEFSGDEIHVCLECLRSHLSYDPEGVEE